MSRQILAIDIRNDRNAVAMLLNLGLKQTIVESTASVSLTDETPVEDPPAETLRRLKETIDPGTASVVVSLPADGIIYRHVTVPFKEESKIRQVLPFELEPLLPVSVDNLNIGFQKNSENDEGEILAVALDQVVYQKYMDALAAANIRPQWIVPGGLPLAGYYASHDEFAQDQLLILDVDVRKTTILAVDAGRIEMVRCLSSELDSDQDIEALALRVRQTLTAINDRKESPFSPAYIGVTGLGAHAPQAYERISKALGLPTEKVDLLQMAPRLEIEESADWHPHQMSNALALALLESEGLTCASFHRSSSPLRNYWTAYRAYVTAPAILLGIALLIGLSSVLIESYLLGKRVDRLNQEIEKVYLSAFPGSSVKGDPLLLMESKIKEFKQGNASTGVNPEQVRTIDVLLHVSKMVPPKVDVRLTRLTMGSGSVTISGETSDFNSVDDIKSGVEKSDLFKQVTIASANMDKSGSKVLFKLKLDL